MSEYSYVYKYLYLYCVYKQKNEMVVYEECFHISISCNAKHTRLPYRLVGVLGQSSSSRTDEVEAAAVLSSLLRMLDLAAYHQLILVVYNNITCYFADLALFMTSIMGQGCGRSLAQ
jgi:hypothetical protein